jgi:hypothetical protein
MTLKVMDLKRVIERIEKSFKFEEESVIHITISENSDPGEGKMCEIMKFDMKTKDKTTHLNIEVYGWSENRPPVAVYTEQLIKKS